MVFTVTDTGIGISERDLGRIFDEFVQIDHPLQQSVKGTGLGLPLSRRLAELLGGRIAVRSTVGVGSSFELTLPLIYRSPLPAPAELAFTPDSTRLPVLVIEDSPVDTLLYAEMLAGSPFEMIAVRTPAEADAALARLTPAVIVLDLRLFGEDSWDLLVRLKQQANTRAVPVIVASHQDEARKGLALGADAYAVKPLTRGWLVDTLMALTRTKPRRALVIDDEEASQFVARRMLTPGFDVITAETGSRGVALALAEPPDVIVLDLLLPDMRGPEVLAELRGAPATASIPVIVLSSLDPEPPDRARLAGASAILNKRTVTREALLEAVAAATAGTPVARGAA